VSGIWVGVGSFVHVCVYVRAAHDIPIRACQGWLDKIAQRRYILARIFDPRKSADLVHMIWMDLRLYVALLNWRRDVISALILRLKARRIMASALKNWASWVQLLRDPPPLPPQPFPRTSTSLEYGATLQALELLSQCVDTWAWYTKVLRFAKKIYLAGIRNAWITWIYFMFKEKQLANHTASRFYHQQLTTVADDWIKQLMSPPISPSISSRDHCENHTSPPRHMESTKRPPAPPPRAAKTSEMLYSMGAPVGSNLSGTQRGGGERGGRVSGGAGQRSPDCYTDESADVRSSAMDHDLKSCLRTIKLEAHADKLRAEFGIETRQDLVRLHDDRITLFRLTKLRIESGDQRKLIRLAQQVKLSTV